MINNKTLLNDELFSNKPAVDWEGEVALITGATSGIGQEITKILAKAKLKVFITGRNKQKLESLKKEISSFGGSVECQQTDLRKEEEIDFLYKKIRQTWGGVRVLVNNAGLGYKIGLIEPNLEKWREMLETNVLAPTICAQKAISDMRKNGDRGHVFNLCSMSGHRVPLSSGMYSATKFAIQSLTEGLRQELRSIKSKIRVSQLSPGFVDTPFLPNYFGGQEESNKALNQLTALEPIDVARMVYTILIQPEHMQIHDILMRPTHQLS